MNRSAIAVFGRCSTRTLSSRFIQFLDHPPTPEVVWTAIPPTLINSSENWTYGVDGKWLGRTGIFLIHRDITHKENLYWSCVTSESYEALVHDTQGLVTLLGTRFPFGAVSDWKGAIRSAVGTSFGFIPHQRCLVHVDRQAKRLCPKQSPFEATRLLRMLATKLLLVKTKEEQKQWQEELTQWTTTYAPMLTEKTIAPSGTRRRWWYTHGNIRRAHRLLTHDHPPLFVFLDNPGIPSTNNALEGVNSQLKDKLGDHRGLSRIRQAAFLSWYMAFSRLKTAQDLKQLWATWKTSISF